MASTKSEKQAIVLMAICASLWSIAGIFIKLIPWNPMVIAGFRSLISAVVVLVYMKITNKRITINRFSILGGIFIACTFFAFVSANKMTTSANAIVLQFTSPIFILVISAILFHQRFHKADLITVIVTLLGISLFFFDKLGTGNLFGNLIAILSGFFMAGMYIITGRADENSRMSGILFGHVFAAMIGVPMMFIFDTPITTTAVLSILALGVVQLGIPYVLYGLAVKNCPPLACSLIGAIEPLLNPVWVFIFNGEAPGLYALVGGAIVIAAVTGWCVWRDRFVAKNTVHKAG